VEILNEGGFRSDGRRQYELRSISIDLSQQGHADGCATLTHGLTQVQVSVFGPREAKMRSHTIHDRANLNVEVSMAAFSMGDRRKRSRGDKYDLYSLSTSRTEKGPPLFLSFLMVQTYFRNFNHY
jgi:exosome complex component RRP41